MRQRIYNMVHVYDASAFGKIYKWLMVVTVLVSMCPLMFKESNVMLWTIDAVCLGIFIVDYILRWVTADYRLRRMHWSSFLKFPLRLASIVDLLTIMSLVASVFNVIRVYYIVAWLKMFRIARVFKYSQNMRLIIRILNNSKKSLLAVGGLSIGYVFVAALIVFNVEPQTFDTFFDALYWSTISLTTVGYGDLYPVTVIGRVFAMVSSFLGIAIVALPAGIVTAEYIKIVKSE